MLRKLVRDAPLQLNNKNCSLFIIEIVLDRVYGNLDICLFLSFYV